ncbi:hypothetical protein ACIO3O_37945 [Streptomyces sp. NPDC087440]|uniref:hypothetical protein n=1 Tax=Streptomyces sp. NPDC087440 TaxID=3365790 RepID=UPI0038073BC7
MTPPAAAILPSRNEAETIAAVVRAADAALDDPNAVIVHADASSGPETAARFAAVPTTARKVGLTGLPLGKGIQVLHALAELGIGTGPILIADTDTRTPDPALYRSLLERCTAGDAYAIADYPRFWDEGNLTNHLARPLIAAATGLDIPQPLAGDLAMNTRAIEAATAAASQLPPALATSVHGYGIDAFLLLTAARVGAVVTVRASAPKLHAASFPHLADIYDQAVPVLLALTGPPTRTYRPAPVDYRLTERELGHPQRSRMQDVLDALAPPDPRYDAHPWPAPVTEAWHRVTTGQASPHDASAALRPYYIHRVRTWLTTPPTARAHLLVQAHRQLAADLTHHQPARSNAP